MPSYDSTLDTSCTSSARAFVWPRVGGSGVVVVFRVVVKFLWFVVVVVVVVCLW